jgi:hypothetical protein
MSTTAEIFVEVPDEIDESWVHGALVGGMVDLAAKKRGALATWFKRAGDTLLLAALASESADELLYPVLFNYRHSIDLYLKAIVEPAPPYSHDLNELIEKFRKVVLAEFGVAVPGWISDRLHEFQNVDARSMTFRYPECGVVFRSGRLQGGEAWVDFHRLKVVMDSLETTFARVLGGLVEKKR